MRQAEARVKAHQRDVQALQEHGLPDLARQPVDATLGIINLQQNNISG